ncbi:MAG: DUF3565 domain-containing protein [Gammaproteobacteria bacterium]|nr:DUF3565 domain-containing protein [Gammaproteobacteria bacterium]
MRHRPPFINRPWVTTEAGRLEHSGLLLDCRLCDNAAVAPDHRRRC